MGGKKKTTMAMMTTMLLQAPNSATWMISLKECRSRRLNRMPLWQMLRSPLSLLATTEGYPFSSQ